MRILSKTSLCSSIAIATAMIVGAKPAAAQVAGTGSFVAGSGTINTSTGNVTLTGTQRYVIDWNATGSVSNGVNNFLPSGNQMNFSSGGDFAVLNRVSTGADMLGLNGSITSTVNGVNGRGTVFFYNPNGIVVGGSAMIDVGSLGLTTADPVPLVGSPSNWFQSFNAVAPTLTFNPANAGSQIRIDPNAQLASNGTNSFVAIVAPKISMSGTIRSDGDVALVAAEAATLSFSDTYDLYGIQVDLGTSVADSLTVDGGTIARNSAVETSGFARNAYLVAVPKNDATTLLITGGASLGFDVANSAVVEGNSVILSAGRDLALFGNQDANGSIHIEDATFSSAVDAFATNSILVNPTAGATTFLSSLEATAGSLIDLDASSGDIGIGGSLLADVADYAPSDTDAQGGTISLTAGSGHTLAVAGNMTLDASAQGGGAGDSGINGAKGTGGSVSLAALGGAISAGDTNLFANGYGGYAQGDATGGGGLGGAISIDVGGGGSLSTGYLYATADGSGGSTIECYSCGITGGAGQGGSFTILAQDSGSSISFDAIQASAVGYGGAGDVAGGLGTGGLVSLIFNGLVDANLGGYAFLRADGEGGYGMDVTPAGAGVGGTAILAMASADNDQPTLTGGYFDLQANGNGGYGGGDGGDGTGGTAFASIDGGNFNATNANVAAAGTGGAAYAGRVGNSTGGIASVALNDASMNLVEQLRIDAGAREPSSEGPSAIGNIAVGGTAILTATNSNIVANQGGQSDNDSVWINAGADGAAASTGNGGLATGGTASLVLDGTTLLAGYVALDAHATGGNSTGESNGGDANGGNIGVSIVNSTVNASRLALRGEATGGDGNTFGGNASGGVLGVDLNGAAVTLTGPVNIRASAFGGAGTASGADGGDAIAATGNLTITDSTLTAVDIFLTGEGYGGDVSGNAAAGDGEGGNVAVTLFGGATVTTGKLFIMASGFGGTNSLECVECGTLGGGGTGGNATLWAQGGNNSLTATANTFILGSGTGGAGDSGGGDGTGIAATMALSDGTTFNFNNAFTFADGIGGVAYGDGNGGNATAGTARLGQSDATGGTIVHSGNNYFHVTAEGFAGAAESGDGGTASGGTAQFLADSLAFSSGSGIQLSAYAVGGDSTAGGNGGDATGGTAQFNVSSDGNVAIGAGINVNTYGEGGDGANGGSATSGNSDVSVNNASLATGTALAADAYSVVLASYAFGGNGAEGDGGSATSGNANLVVGNGGSLTATSLHVSTGAQGGNSDGGTRAGDADGGFAMVRAESGGTIAAAGGTKIRALAVGGTGTGGADGGTASADALALLNSVGGGSVSIAGDLEINTDRAGGDGHNGGDALAIINYQTPTVGETYPVSEIFANGGSVTVGGVTTLTSNAIGGNGEYGGDGGNAYGGTVSIRAVNGAAGPSAVTLGDLSMTATSTAGNGGDGISSEIGDGGNGGDGGDVLAGMIFIQAMSLNGQVSTGDLTLATTSQAGNGGWGGSGINGGNGGQGGSVIGNWSAGAINLSQPSGGNPPGLPLVTNGFAHFGTIVADTSATGGSGGWGGWAYDGANGTAGNGGSAQSGDFYIINRGGDFAAGDFTWTFDATGGAAGANPNESPAGVGGDASTGQFLLVNSNRSGQIDQRGTMSFGDVVAVATSTGGSGLVDGRSFHASNLDFEAVNADTHLGSLTFAVDATDGPVIDTYDFTSQIVVDNGSILVDGDLSLTLPESLAVWVNNGSLAANSITLDAANFVHAANRPYPTTLGLVDTGALYITTGQDIVIDANIDVGGALGLTAPGSVSIGSATSGDGDIAIYADGGFVLTNALDAAGSVTIHAAGDIDTSDVSGYGDIDLMGAAVDVGNVYGSGDVSVVAALDLNAGDISSGGDMSLSAGGYLNAGSLYSSYGSIHGFAGYALDIADADAGLDLDLTVAGGDLTIANYSQAYGDIDLNATGLIQTANLSAEGGISAVGGAIDVGNLVAGTSLGGGIGTFALGAGDIGLWSGSTVDAGTLTAAGRIGVAAPGAITVGSLTAGDLVMLLGGDAISTGAILTDGELFIAGYDMFALGYDPQTDEFDPAPVLAQAPTASGGSVLVNGSISASTLRAHAGTSFGAGLVTTTSGGAWIRSHGNLATGAIDSAGDVDLAVIGTGNISTGTIDSGGAVTLLTTAGSAAVGAVGAVDAIDIRANQGINAGAATSQTAGVLLRANNGAITSAGASGAGTVGIAGGGNVTVTGAIVAGGTAGVDSGGNANVQSMSSGASGEFLEIRADGNVSFTNINGGTPVWLAAGGNISGGNVSGTDYALVMAGGTVNLTSLTASGNGSNAAIANYDAYFDAVGQGGFDAPSFLDAMHFSGPAGAVTVGSINAQTVFADTGSLSVGNLTANVADLTASGLASVNGTWNVPFLSLTSGDINIANNASIIANDIDLHSTNSVGAAIGDNSGVAQGGYLLNNAEFGRIHADHLVVLAHMNASPVDLLIGNLDLAGGNGQYYDLGVVNSNGDYVYDGRLRVVGKISGQNFVDGDRLDLDAQLIEIDAVNGGIDFSPNSDATVGTLAFFSQRVHIAETSVLDKLNADTQYAGRDLDLATAPTANHSDTTINVGTIDVYLFDPNNVGGLAVPAAAPTYTIYNQNMGSTGVRSGLLIADANLYGDIAPGSVEMILNGKLVDVESGQTLQGAAVRDAFVVDPENDLTRFTTSSSINGCSLVGNGCFTPEPPAPPPTPQVEDLANQFVFLDNSIGDQLGFGDDLDSGDGDSDDEDGDKTEEKNAIDPPPSLINGKPLDPQTPTDEPVSGTGNPALIGTGSSQQEQQ